MSTFFVGTRFLPNFLGLTAFQSVPTLPYSVCKNVPQLGSDFYGCGWWGVEQAKGVRVWAQMDAWVAMHAGKDIVFTLLYAPAWWQQSDVAAWRDWVRAVGQRYAGKIRYWEISNEPDGVAMAPAKWAELARVAYLQLKECDPHNKILGPSVNNIGDVGRARIKRLMSASAEGYSFKWYDSGRDTIGADWIDILAVHTYCGAPEDNILAFAQLQTYGKPVWVSEMMDFTITPQRLQRHLLIAAASGVERELWFGYDHSTAGIRGRPELEAAWQGIADWLQLPIQLAQWDGAALRTVIGGNAVTV